MGLCLSIKMKLFNFINRMEILPANFPENKGEHMLQLSCDYDKIT